MKSQSKGQLYFYLHNQILIIIYAVLLVTTLINEAIGQKATIEEGVQSIPTYPYFDPNPIPSLGINHKVSAYYPYFIFDGYSDKKNDQDWKVVTLENDYIKVTVLPEVGGKVMGAIEKSTGKEFIYINHVMKFRAIGIRGPWTSGGIEHNFGLDLGHAPWTASKVDYLMKENADESVSCIVGGLDLASRTQWRVDIRLPKDKAYFETRSIWYNPTPLHDSYLSWEIAAYKGTDDLQFYFPGTYYIGHDGDVHKWPINAEGRNLSLYKENNFGTSKSYHTAGVFPNWFGGYFHNSNFGSGHWSSYDDAPGKKLWIWSLARDGAIWEDLLTDGDGQYIEAQSGVKLNQAHPWGGFNTPYNQLFMRPYYTETKSDFWFPVKETGGMVTANPNGTLNLASTENELKISFCSNVDIYDSIIVKSGEKTILSELLVLKPMQVYQKTVSLRGGDDEVIRVDIGQNLLNYTSDIEEIKIDRPTETPVDQDFNSAEHLFRQAEDMYSMRDYQSAIKTYEACLAKEPTHSRALTKLAEIYYRQAQYEKGLAYARKVLENNTYDPGANFIFGVMHKAMGNMTMAKEAFSVSVRSMEYRSASYVQISGLHLQTGNYAKASEYARKALDYNKYNVAAYEFLSTSYRKQNEVKKAEETLELLLEIDPLNHYAHFEQYLLNPSNELLSIFTSAIRNELPHESYLELALIFANQNLTEEAIIVLEQAPDYPIVKYWLAYLTRKTDRIKSEQYLAHAIKISPKMVFPFRLETIPVLRWAIEQNPSWKTKYYLGLVYWKALQINDAINLFEQCGNSPNYAIFYVSRGLLLQNDKHLSAGKDFEKAKKLNEGEWRTWYYLNKYFERTRDIKRQIEVSKRMFALFPDNPIVGIANAQALLNANNIKECLKVLKEVNVLPAEFANSGHGIFEKANISKALSFIELKKFKKAIEYLKNSKKYPENLGSGAPYEPDHRLQDIILAYCENQLENKNMADKHYQQIIDYSEKHLMDKNNSANAYISLLVLKSLGKIEEANSKIKNWKLGADTSAPDVQWMLAKFNNDEEKVKNLESEIVANLLENSKFTLFLRAIHIIETNVD